jgi:hypothetical protein
MRFTEIAEQSGNSGWKQLRDPVDSNLLDQIPQYYQRSHNIWALNPSKSNTPLMAVLSFGLWGPIINDQHFSETYVSSKLTELAVLTGKTSFIPREGYIWHNNQALPFFDVYKFPEIAPAYKGMFWYEIPISDDVLSPTSHMEQRKIANHCYAILNPNSLTSAKELLGNLFGAYMAFTKDRQLVSISSTLSQKVLQNLVDALGLEDSSMPHGSVWLIHNGKVVPVAQLAFSDPQPSLDDGTKVWLLPTLVRRSLSLMHFDKVYKSADQAYVVQLPGVQEQDLAYSILVAVKKGEIIGYGRGVHTKATEPQLAQLGQKLSDSLGLVASKDKFIKPNSNFHKMLQYVNENPGSPRSGYYVRGLGLSLQGLQPIDSPKSLDGLASRLGLLTLKDPGDKATQYHLRLTRQGVFYLQGLNRGVPLNITRLAKKSTE